MGGGESALLFILNVKTFVIKLHTNAPMYAGCIVETSQLREILALDIYLFGSQTAGCTDQTTLLACAMRP